MRFSSSGTSLVVTALAVALLAPAPADARRTHVRASITLPETVVVDVPAPPVPPALPRTAGRKRIIIGGSGVRIDDQGVSVHSDSDSVDFNFTFKNDTGNLGEDIVRVGESVYVTKDQVVAGDVVVFGGNAIIEGTVAGTVVVLGGEIRLRNGAEVRGDVVSIGGSVEEDDEVVVRGEKIVVGGVAGTIGNHLNVSAGFVRAAFGAMSMFIGLVLFVVTMLFLRGRVERVSEHVSATTLKCFGAGVLASIALLFGLSIVMIPLILIVVGIPFAVMLGVSCLGIFAIACTTFVYSTGRVFADRTGAHAGVFTRLILGLFLLSIPELIAFGLAISHGSMPVWVVMKCVSLFVWLFAYVVGLGGIVLSRFGSRPVGTEPPASRVVGEPAGVPAT